MVHATDTDVELRDVHFTHPSSPQPTLAGIDLRIAAGEMLAVVGPSGSGKTSALRILAGLEQPERGDVLIGGVSQLGVAPERRSMSMMFQRPLLFAHLNVLDNIAFSARVRGAGRRAAREQARAFLELVHLPELAMRHARALSGGQEQRVALARALASSPRVLLLDEPFGSLDPGVRASMHDLLAEVRAVLEPTTVIVTHDLDEAALADRIAVLVDGNVHQLGTAHELYHRPASLAVARVLGGFAEIPGHLTAGTHQSVFGAIPLTRHEQNLTALAEGDGASGGQPAVLLVRREALRITAAGDPGSMFTATVTAVRQRGLRRSVILAPEPEVTASGSARLEAEVDPQVQGSTSVSCGARVGVARTEIPLTVLAASASSAAPDARPEASPAAPGAALVRIR